MKLPAKRTKERDFCFKCLIYVLHYIYLYPAKQRTIFSVDKRHKNIGFASELKSDTKNMLLLTGDKIYSNRNKMIACLGRNCPQQL